MRYFLFLLVLGLVFVSCGKDEFSQEDIDKQYNKDIQLIEDYLKAKNLNGEKTVQGVYYILENPGEEIKPKITSTVKVNYKGYYLDDVQFDASPNAEFRLSDVIEGWQIGIPKYGKSGKGKLFIPSKYGYANSPPPGIRENAVLVFDIELLDIK